MRIFKSKIVAFALLVVFMSYKAYAEVVNKVQIKGNERISAETIVIFADIKIGSNYEVKDINLIIKKLYDSTFFSDISVELQDGILNIDVTENPIVNLIEFKGEKANKYIDKIKELLTLREKSSFLENYVNTDIRIINEFYKALGFYFVEIDTEIVNLENNRVNLIYSITKGDKAKIAKIFFLGDKKIRDKKLRDVITSQEAKLWKFISRNVYLNKGRIELDKRLLVNYYKNKGYYEVKISSSNVEYSEGEGFLLTFSIDAGKRYRFKKISANISDALDKSAFTSLESEFDKVIGDYYSQKKLVAILEEIDVLSEQKELQFINHRVEETLEGDGVEVKINIFEGPKFTIERINIIGNSVTNDAVIRGELIVDEGDPYSALLVNKSINKLKARRIFGSIDQKIKDGSSPDLKVLEITVEEKATGEIAAGAGVGTDGTSFMFSVTENNWLGRGIRLDSSVNVTQETLSGSIAVNNPNFNYTGNSVFSALELSSSDMTTSSGYKSTRTGYSLGTEFEQYQNVYLSPSFVAQIEEITVEDSATDSVKKMKGSFNNLDFNYGITLDERNQPFQPTSGYIAKFSQSIPIVMDSSSFLNGITVSTYHDFSENLIGAIKFSGKAITGVDEDVRLTHRLYIPQKRLRGFNTKRVGPKDGVDWVGGNYISTLGVEAQLPKLLPESSRTDISLFLDSGNVWGVDYNSSLDNSNTYRSSVGIAANVYTVIGPLSFTFAQAITKSNTDETETFNFRLGTSF